jgi:hypothetical protein
MLVVVVVVFVVVVVVTSFSKGTVCCGRVFAVVDNIAENVVCVCEMCMFLFGKKFVTSFFSFGY